MIYTVLLTFMLGTAHVEMYRTACPEWACVEDIIAHAHESRALTRLRVFEGAPGMLPASGTLFPAKVDLSFN